MATIASLAVNFVARTAELRRGLDQATAQNRRFVNNARRQFGGLQSTFLNLRTAFAGVFAGFGVAGFTRLADEFIQINNLLRASGFEGEELADAFARVQQITRVTRGDLEATGRLYALLNRNAASLNATQTEIAAVTAAVQQAFALAGASTQEAAGATRQLSQALASGVLRGQELNSVMEQAPLIARAIADNLNISLGELRALAAEGRITSQVVFGSILNEAEELNNLFQASNITFGQLARLLRNELVPVFGELAERLLPGLTRLTATFAGIIQAVSFYADALVTILQVGLVVALNRVAFLLGGAIARGITLTIASFRALALAATTLSFSLRTLTGPIAILVTAFQVLAVVFGDQLVAAFRAATNFIIANVNRLINSLDRLIEFFGGNGIDFRFQEWTGTMEETGNALESLTGDVNQFVDALDEARLAELNSGLGDVDEEAEEATEAVSIFSDRVSDELDSLSGLIDRTLTGLVDGVTDIFVQGRTDVRAFANDIIREFIRIQVRSAFTRFLGIPFGGFRQQGGPVAAGQAYVVGEAGPELFVPGMRGNIVPNGASASGGSTQITYNINAVDARSFQQLVAQDPSFIHNVSERGRRQLGGLAR